MSEKAGAASPTQTGSIHKFPVVDPLTPKEVHWAQGLVYDVCPEGRMPKLNTQNPGSAALSPDTLFASYWIASFDIDGWRL